jgi:hypothetical protein
MDHFVPETPDHLSSIDASGAFGSFETVDSDDFLAVTLFNPLLDFLAAASLR